MGAALFMRERTASLPFPLRAVLIALPAQGPIFRCDQGFGGTAAAGDSA